MSLMQSAILQFSGLSGVEWLLIVGVIAAIVVQIWLVKRSKHPKRNAAITAGIYAVAIVLVVLVLTSKTSLSV